ncbi:ARM repeat-containing protein [Ascodesmis nigricans]|uniref:ARM repeat-containing protein n=1 Tax=Ascodesmis nigricans TaxID=341454 RepID=A0A4V3SI30_9PEZI|nr:ARM repeat-containing protein [Ascodesmis nigricans]
MSVKDSQALDLLDLLRGQDVDKKIAEFTAIKTQVKHQAVQPEAIAPLFEASRIGVLSPNNALSAQALSCLGHLTRRVTIQEPGRIRHHVNSILPVLVEKLGDAKDRNRSVAMKAIQDLYDHCPVEVEKHIKELGFASKNPRTRQESINWLAKTHASHPGFAIRSYTPILMQMLEDATEAVRETAKEVSVELFRNAPDHAKSDLKRELTKRQVRKGIATYIIAQLGLPGGAEAVTASVGNGHAEPFGHKPVKSATGGGSKKPEGTFLESLPGTEMEPMDPAYVNTNRELEDMLEDMLPAFEGRESEHNWMVRERNITKLRQLARGNAPKDYLPTFQAGIKSLLDGILKVVNSLRTTVASNGCQLMKDLAIVMGPSLDPMLDIILSNIIKLCAGTKKITSQLGQIVVALMVANVSYHPKVLNYIHGACTDKNVSPRSYVPGWITVFLETHLHQKGQIEHSGGVDILEKSIRKGLADPNPAVREAMRKTYWKFASIWPEKGNIIIESLEGSHRKLLEKANPSGASAVPAAGAHPAGPSRTQSAPARPSIRDAILAQKRQKSNLASQVDSGSVRSASPAPIGLGLSSAAARRPGLKTRPVSEKPPSELGYNRSASPAPSHPPRGATPHGSRTGPAGTRSPPLSPQIGRFARSTTPARSAGAHAGPSRKLNIMEQLNHPDWQVRVEGIVTVACVLARRTPPGYEGQKMPILPPSDTFAPTLAKLFNDPQPEVVEHVVAPEVLAELTKVVPLEQIIPKVLLLAEGADEQHAQPIATSSLPALKRLMTESEASDLLFTIIKSMSTSGVVPRKLALGSFTTTQKRKILNSALVWMNEIVESHARGTPNEFFAQDSSYNSVVNRLLGLMGSKLANAPVLALLLQNLETLDPSEFSKILDTFEPAMRKELLKAWGQSVEENEPVVIEEKVADVEQVLGSVPQIGGTSPAIPRAVSPSPQTGGVAHEELGDLPPLPKSPTDIVDLSASIASRVGLNKPVIEVYLDPSAISQESAVPTDSSGKVTGDTETQRPKLRKQNSASTLPKTQEGTTRLLETLVERLQSRDMDTQAFRKLSNIIKNNPARGVLKEQNGSEIVDIWQGETTFEDLLSSLLGYLVAEDITSPRADDLQTQALLVLKNLLSKVSPYFSRHETTVFITLLTMCGRFSEGAMITWHIEDILEQFMAIANPQAAIDAILNYMHPAANGTTEQKRPQGSWCMALKCLGDLVRESQLSSLEPQLGRLGEFAVKSMVAEEPKIREACVRMCTEMHSKVNDDQRLFDEILHGLKWGHTNLLTYYFTKREGEARQ